MILPMPEQLSCYPKIRHFLFKACREAIMNGSILIAMTIAILEVIKTYMDE